MRVCAAVPLVALLLGVSLYAPIHANANVAVIAVTTIDFSTHGEGQFPGDFYKKDGVVFTQGSFVGFVQGDEALIGDIAGRFSKKVVSLSARIAPALQGTHFYTLSALDASFAVVASTTVTVTQEPFGYFTVDLGTLPAKAKYFTLSSDLNGIYGISSITFAIE